MHVTMYILQYHSGQGSMAHKGLMTVQPRHPLQIVLRAITADQEFPQQNCPKTVPIPSCHTIICAAKYTEKDSEKVVSYQNRL